MAVATLRSDFLGVFQNHLRSKTPPTESDLTICRSPSTQSQLNVTRNSLKSPAHRAGLAVEASLTVRLLQDAGQLDSLPLLAFTASRLYDLYSEDPQAKRLGKLALREYVELEGLTGSVKNAAERIFKILTLAQRKLMNFETP